MTLLSLNLHREFFDAILDGSKTIEYRDNSPFWQKRLRGKSFTHVRFRNGYLKNAPEAIVVLKKIVERADVFEIHLGKIVETSHTDR